MKYGAYNVMIILEPEQEKRLEKLEEQFKKFNGWNKQEIIQFAIDALPKNIEIALTFMEIKADWLGFKL